MRDGRRRRDRRGEAADVQPVAASGTSGGGAEQRPLPLEGGLNARPMPKGGAIRPIEMKDALIPAIRESDLAGATGAHLRTRMRQVARWVPPSVRRLIASATDGR